MKSLEGRRVRPPVELLLGALSVVARPLVRGEDDEDMTETAQFYGYEDFGDRFLNVSPRISKLVAYRPTRETPGCIIALDFHGFVLPGAFSRACCRWAKMVRLVPAGRNAWRGNGLVLTLHVTRHRLSGGRLTATLAPLDGATRGPPGPGLPQSSGS